MQFEVERKLQVFEEVVEWILFKELTQELPSQPLPRIKFKTKSNSCIRLEKEASKKEYGTCWEEIMLTRNSKTSEQHCNPTHG